MSDMLTKRDIQAGLEQAWHRKTTVVEEVNRSNSMPFEVIESELQYIAKKLDEQGIQRDVVFVDPDFKRLIANDDFLPVGEPYGPSYNPSSVAMFWEVIRIGMGDVPHTILSAGTVENRSKLFATIKISDGFSVAGRKFEDYITVLDSFDKSTCLQVRYNNVCVVCSNTFAVSLVSGTTVGKAKHTFNIDANVERLVNAMAEFTGTSKEYQEMLQRAHDTNVSRDEARAWVASQVAKDQKELSNQMVQKIARIMELFDCGRGNEGQNRLDAFCAFTDFYSNESSNRKGEGAQYAASEWGTSATVKTQMAVMFESAWDWHVQRGAGLLLKLSEEQSNFKGLLK